MLLGVGQVAERLQGVVDLGALEECLRTYTGATSEGQAARRDVRREH